MTRTKRRSVSIAGLPAVAIVMAGCHSLAELRVHRTVHTDRESAMVGIWIRAPGPVLSDPEHPVYDAAIALVFYPWDVVSSTIAAVRAPFDADLAITWGPIGAVAGIALPGLTLMPYLYPARHVTFPPDAVELDAASLDELASRIAAGDGVAAYREIVGDFPWDGGEAAMIAVEWVEAPRARRAVAAHMAR